MPNASHAASTGVVVVVDVLESAPALETWGCRRWRPRPIAARRNRPSAAPRGAVPRILFPCRPALRSFNAAADRTRIPTSCAGSTPLTAETHPAPGTFRCSRSTKAITGTSQSGRLADRRMTAMRAAGRGPPSARLEVKTSANFRRAASQARHRGPAKKRGCPLHRLERFLFCRMPSSSIRNASVGTADDMRLQAAAAAVRNGFRLRKHCGHGGCGRRLVAQQSQCHGTPRLHGQASESVLVPLRRKNSTSFASSLGFTQGLPWLERAISASRQRALRPHAGCLVELG